MRNRVVIFALPFRGRDEFLPLRGISSLDVEWVRPQDYEGGARIIILPGSGRTIDDLIYLRQNGGVEKIRRHLAAGGFVLGVCGGFQMLGQLLLDPGLKQGPEAAIRGLGYLPHSTLFGPAMMSSATRAKLLVGAGTGGEIAGEEHRSGFSWTESDEHCYRPLLAIDSRTEIKPEHPIPQPQPFGSINWAPGSEIVDGLVSADRQVMGTYVHLICHNPAFVRTLLERL